MSAAPRRVKSLPSEAREVTKATARRKSKPTPAMLPVWTGEEYARIPPGRYTAVAVRIVGPQRLRRWSRWSVGIVFRPLSEPDAEVVLFLNLDDGKVKRYSDYFRYWTQANGASPMKGEEMDANVFLEGGIIYEIEVIDANIDADGNRKSDAEVYSKVRRIISLQREVQSRAGVLPFKEKR